MATYQAIAATGKAILGVLRDARTPGLFEGFSFELYHASDFQSPMKEGIALYLYQVAPNTAKRNLSPRVDAEGCRFRPSLPVDIHFLLVPWAQKADTQQFLLTWAIRVLEDMSILPASVLNHYGEGDIFHTEEAVELIWEPLPLQEIVHIWDAFKPNFQISVSYVVRMLEIDSELPLAEASLVQTRVINFARRSVS